MQTVADTTGRHACMHACRCVRAYLHPQGAAGAAEGGEEGVELGFEGQGGPWREEEEGGGAVLWACVCIVGACIYGSITVMNRIESNRPTDRNAHISTQKTTTYEEKKTKGKRALLTCRGCASTRAFWA